MTSAIIVGCRSIPFPGYTCTSVYLRSVVVSMKLNGNVEYSYKASDINVWHGPTWADSIKGVLP